MAAVAHYPWRTLGELLVEKALLHPDELDAALLEQRRTGGCSVSSSSSAG